VRSDQALGQDEHPGTRGHAAAERGDRGGQRARRHGEADDVVVVELEGGCAHDVDVVRQPDVRQVARVHARGDQLVDLLGRAAAEVDLEPRASERNGETGAP
jgi:hypothetical protein